MGLILCTVVIEESESLLDQTKEIGMEFCLDPPGGAKFIIQCAEPWQLGSQDAATPIMQGIIDLHHDIFFFLILILVFVLWILVRALWHFHYKKNAIPQRIVHGTTIEILRTIFPSIISMFIAIPSFALLYSMDEVVVDPAITIKAIGHQWYRTYEYSDYNSSDEQSLTFDSYMIPEEDLELGQSRLLEVDNRVVVPAKTHLRIIVTSADVPHSWAVPSSGVKCDAVPGRLNQISILVQREGVYYGQCSEICGTNHAFTRAPGNIGRLLSPTLAQPHHPGCEPPEKQAITVSGWSCREPRSKVVDKIEERARHPVEQRGRALHTEQASLRDETPAQGPQFSLGGRTKDLWKSCEGGQSKIVLFLYKDNRRSQRLGATLFLSYSSFFMISISCRAVYYESGKPGIINMRDPEGWAGLPQGFFYPLFPGWERSPIKNTTFEADHYIGAIAKPSRIKASSPSSNSKRPTYSLFPFIRGLQRICVPHRTSNMPICLMYQPSQLDRIQYKGFAFASDRRRTDGCPKSSTVDDSSGNGFQIAAANDHREGRI
ncbi:unnamed protein product (mitochondrion) [Arabidopsis thaliana]|uniref:Cytochrome c oxidase subunit 2 n=1 Tax=Arabidopsis thaliana TaxID=3702 RepID=A0A7G2FJN5_ARATH|nr:unnamed protein product [Arabidopsis thaliana]